MGDTERRDRYLEAINKVSVNKNNKAKYSEYKDGDKDFDDVNYDEKNRVGDTDFFSFKRDDGKTVIVEEDMKWVLPEGVDPKSPAIKSALNKFASEVESKRSLGENYTGDDWRNGVNDALNDAIEKEMKKNK